MDWSLKRQFSSKACIPIRQFEARSKLNNNMPPAQRAWVKCDQTPFWPSTKYEYLDLNSFLHNAILNGPPQSLTHWCNPVK